MSNVYRMNRPKNFLQTMKFRTFNEAIAFSSKSGLLKPTKPYPRNVWIDGEYLQVWCVTLATTVGKPSNATYELLAA
jgi:hypothetical protein